MVVFRGRRYHSVAFVSTRKFSLVIFIPYLEQVALYFFHQMVHNYKSNLLVSLLY